MRGTSVEFLVKCMSVVVGGGGCGELIIDGFSFVGMRRRRVAGSLFGYSVSQCVSQSVSSLGCVLLLICKLCGE